MAEINKEGTSGVFGGISFKGAEIESPTNVTMAGTEQLLLRKLMR